ncbi:MAG: AAA family ATPase, partial [Myxococcota bacterium]|nr:AAA family ATPase [Myxococcota bacterium]
MPSQLDDPLNPTQAIDHLTELLASSARVLLVGASGTGKSTLARAACERLEPGSTTYICADPGRPAFGPPGALTRARFEDGGWRILQLEGISTMDCARFRAPLLGALARLSMRCERD